MYSAFPVPKTLDGYEAFGRYKITGPGPTDGVFETPNIEMTDPLVNSKIMELVIYKSSQKINTTIEITASGTNDIITVGDVIAATRHLFAVGTTYERIFRKYPRGAWKLRMEDYP